MKKIFSKLCSQKLYITIIFAIIFAIIAAFVAAAVINLIFFFSI